MVWLPTTRRTAIHPSFNVHFHPSFTVGLRMELGRICQRLVGGWVTWQERGILAQEGALPSYTDVVWWCKKWEGTCASIFREKILTFKVLINLNGGILWLAGQAASQGSSNFAKASKAMWPGEDFEDVVPIWEGWTIQGFETRQHWVGRFEFFKVWFCFFWFWVAFSMC